MDLEKFVDSFISTKVKKITETRITTKTGAFTKDVSKFKSWCEKNKDFLRDVGCGGLLSMDDSEILKFLGESLELIEEKTTKATPKEVQAVRKILDEEEKRRAESTSGNELDPSEFMPVIDLEADTDRDRYKLIHWDTQKYVSNFHPMAWKEVMGHEHFNMMKARFPRGIFRYNPRETKRSFSGVLTELPTLGGEVYTTVFNTHTPPSWRKEKRPHAECPEEMDKFFKHLFPDAECRRYVFEKVHQILEERLGVFLVMNGVTGIGKGLFTEELLKFGVGAENYTLAPNSWDKSNFNAWLKNKQIILLDETKVEVDGQENVNLLKRIINEQQSIEEKGKDPKLPIRSYASFFITSNNGVKNFKMELDNRRFSVLDLTTTKYKEAFDEQEQKDILHALTKDDDKRSEFFWWILRTFPKHKQRYPDTLELWKGPTYFKFKYESLSNWKRFIVDICTGKDVKPEYKISLLGNMYEEYAEENGWLNARWTVKVTTIENFLNEYLHMDENRIGKIVRRGEENFLLVNDRFVGLKEKLKQEKGYEDVNDL